MRWSKQILLIFIKILEIWVAAMSRGPEGPNGNGNELKPLGRIKFNQADNRKMRAQDRNKNKEVPRSGDY